MKLFFTDSESGLHCAVRTVVNLTVVTMATDTAVTTFVVDAFSALVRICPVCAGSRKSRNPQEISCCLDS